jgi:hypothetical protein
LRPLLSTFLRSVGIAAVAAFVAQGLVPGGAGLVGAFVDLVLGGVVFSGLIALGARWVGDAAMRDGLQRLVARVPGLRRRASG